MQILQLSRASSQHCETNPSQQQLTAWFSSFVSVHGRHRSLQVQVTPQASSSSDCNICRASSTEKRKILDLMTVDGLDLTLSAARKFHQSCAGQLDWQVTISDSRGPQSLRLIIFGASNNHKRGSCCALPAALNSWSNSRAPTDSNCIMTPGCASCTKTGML